MQIVEIPIAFPGIPRKLFPKGGKSFCKGKRKGPYTSSASAMLFAFEINQVMKLFVQVQIPCEVGTFTDGKQKSTETKPQ